MFVFFFLENEKEEKRRFSNNKKGQFFLLLRQSQKIKQKNGQTECMYGKKFSLTVPCILCILNVQLNGCDEVVCRLYWVEFLSLFPSYSNFKLFSFTYFSASNQIFFGNILKGICLMDEITYEQQIWNEYSTVFTNMDHEPWWTHLIENSISSCLNYGYLFRSVTKRKNQC